MITLQQYDPLNNGKDEWKTLATFFNPFEKAIIENFKITDFYSQNYFYVEAR